MPIDAFYNDGTWDCPSDVNEVEVLVVAGGGGVDDGDSSNGYGGGGAGGVVYHSSYSVSGSYSVTVGHGGGPDKPGYGDYGDDSVFGDLTALGGGSGATTDGSGGDGGSGGGSGQNGGSGGSADQPGTNPSADIDAGNVGAGGNGSFGGGGGGAGEDGIVDYGGSDGGDGVYIETFSSYGDDGWFGGGGAGGDNYNGGSGDYGYGGKGGGGDSPGHSSPHDGEDGTGGGGGGRSANGVTGYSNGGDGIVLVGYNLVEVPSNPYSLSANNNSNNEIYLNWSEPSDWGNDVGEYKIYRGKESGTHYLITRISSSSMTDTGLDNGEKYFYVVKATNSAGDSNNSNEASSVIELTEPTNISANYNA